MKASPNDQKELLRLQAADTKMQQLNHIARNLPQLAELAILAPQVESVRQRLNARNGELEDARIELRRIESDVEVVEARIVRDAGRLEQTSSMKDVQGLETELASLRKRRDDLEEIELTVMERIEGIESAAAEIESERATLANQVDALEAAVDAERSTIDAQKKALSADRAAVWPRCPKTWSRSMRSSGRVTASGPRFWFAAYRWGAT